MLSFHPLYFGTKSYNYYFCRILEQGVADGKIVENAPELIKSYVNCSMGKLEEQTLVAGTLMHLTKSSVLAGHLIFSCWSEIFNLMYSGIHQLGEDFKRYFHIKAFTNIKIYFSFQLFPALSSGAAGALQQFAHLLSVIRVSFSTSK
jgi:hypothetical protein